MITENGIKFCPSTRITQNSDLELDKKVHSENDDETHDLEYRFEATLHALIGVLIRYESEMCISDDTFSLRNLNNKKVDYDF